MHVSVSDLLRKSSGGKPAREEARRTEEKSNRYVISGKVSTPLRSHGKLWSINYTFRFVPPKAGNLGIHRLALVSH